MRIRKAWILGLLLGATAQGADEPPPGIAQPPAATRRATYKKTAQAELELHLYLPQDWKAEDKRPAVVFFFGGVWSRGTVEQFAVQAAHLAERGMVAACADYRVKTRHGVRPDSCVEDAKSAVRWIRANAATLGVDPGRIAAAGGSAGGHIALCTAVIKGFEAEGEDLSVSSKPDALIGFNPAIDPQVLVNLMPKHEETARAISPLLHLEAGLPPTLVMIGTSDPFFKSCREFTEKARTLGARAELMAAEKQPHGFFNRPPWLDRTTRKMDDFLVGLGWLKPRE